MSESNAYGEDYQDAYVFVPSGSEDTMDKLRGLWREKVVRYAIRVLSGGFGAVAFLEAPKGDDGLVELRGKITRVRDEVNPGTSVGIALRIGPYAPTRWSRKLKIGAYVRKADPERHRLRGRGVRRRREIDGLLRVCPRPRRLGRDARAWSRLVRRDETAPGRAAAADRRCAVDGQRHRPQRRRRATRPAGSVTTRKAT